MFALCACTDEKDPATWVKRLDDPKQRVAAIAWLEKSPDRDKTIVPLVNEYVRGGLDDTTRAKLIEWLGAQNDFRALPAFAKAFEDCGADIEVAASSVAVLARSSMTSDATPKPLFDCFVRYKASTGSSGVAKALHDAVLALHDASYPARAAVMLEAPVNPADSFDEHGVHRVNDQLEVWQKTALEILVAKPDPHAARAITAVLMTREKRTLWPLARAALAKDRTASVPLVISALDGSDAAFAKLRAAWARDDGYVPNLVEALADESTDRARDAVIAAVPTMTSDSNRAALAESLTWFPHTPAIVTAFQSIYASLAPESLERSALLQAAGDLFDPKLLPWVLGEGAKSGTGDQAVGAKAGAIQSAIKLMQPGDEARVAAALDALEFKSGLSPIERGEIGRNIREIHAAATSALAQCGRDVRCYVAVASEKIPQEPHANWKAIKAATMCGILGDDATRSSLVVIATGTKNPGVRLALARAINQLAPHGDLREAAVLDAIASGESLDPDDAIARVSRMLRARATP